MDKSNVCDTSDYFFNISHELRNALNIMMASCTMASRHIDDRERALDYLKKIHLAGDRITGLIDNTLEISKIKQGGINLVEEPFSIDDLEEELRLLLDPLAADKNLNLYISADSCNNREMIGDYGQLLRMIINLATNSIKYTPEGGNIRISFEETVNCDAETAEFICKCHDDGIGISEDFLEHIFEPFARADDDRVSEAKGTGLGMVIVKETVEAMGGSIHIESMIDVGTTVTVIIRMKKNIRKA